MNEAKIEKLIINSPYDEPCAYWKYNRETRSFDRTEGRRPSGYYVANQKAKDSKSYDNEGKFISIELVNQIRPRVKAWRESGWPGVTSTTRKLLAHWHDRSMRTYPFFFCQLDAIETLIWLSETREGQMMMIQDDGSRFRRLCTKLCTGGGKTIVMAMLIAWQVCNKAGDSRSTRYSKNVLIVAPNLTVKKRLEVLKPGSKGDYYERFDVVPAELSDRMNQARIIIQNWQALEFDSPEDIAKRKSVDKRGVLSDNAYTRKLLGRNMQNLLVINDEAHHAWRVKPEDKATKGLTKEQKKEQQEDQKEATIWIQGLDKIHNAARILTCYDFSATPFVQGRGKNNAERLFEWIVSDFSLSDGIESGLVKTPHVVVKDNTPEKLKNVDKSKLFHIYSDESVKDNLTNSQPPEALLPDLVRNAYMLLASDWKDTFDRWRESGKNVPPVMISVANCTATAARIEKFFADESLNMPELCGADKILRIDSSVLGSSNSSKELELREKADTVGQEGRPGEQLSNIISVGMLSEGWDAKTVTHIMGLRAFSSQLLCEQVVGRGLRRTSYEVNDDGLFSPEYVNIFGVPFTFLPHEDDGGSKTGSEGNTYEVKVLPERSEFAITWPNLLRVEYVVNQKLTLDVNAIPELELNAESTRIIAELVPVIDGQTDLSRCSYIDINKLFSTVRLQTLEFKTANEIYDEMQAQTKWQQQGVKLKLIGQVIRLVNKYIERGNIKIYPELFVTDSIRKKILVAMNLEKIIRHIWSYIRSESSDEVLPVFCEKKTRSTGDMARWWTRKGNRETVKSHINLCVFDSNWEESEAFCLERNPNVRAYAKNDHLGFYVSYLYNGVIRRYFPDFLIRLDDERYLILEVKGQESDQDRVKRRALSDWCRAVNQVKHYGHWCCDVSRSPADIDGIIKKNLTASRPSQVMI